MSEPPMLSGLAGSYIYILSYHAIVILLEYIVSYTKALGPSTYRRPLQLFRVPPQKIYITYTIYNTPFYGL